MTQFASNRGCICTFIVVLYPQFWTHKESWCHFYGSVLLFIFHLHSQLQFVPFMLYHMIIPLIIILINGHHIHSLQKSIYTFQIYIIILFYRVPSLTTF